MNSGVVPPCKKTGFKSQLLRHPLEVKEKLSFPSATSAFSASHHLFSFISLPFPMTSTQPKNPGTVAVSDSGNLLDAVPTVIIIGHGLAGRSTAQALLKQINNKAMKATVMVVEAADYYGERACVLCVYKRRGYNPAKA